MRRWHSERDLMLRRWRQELATHTDNAPDRGWGRPYDSMVPSVLACEIDCHCANGMGTMRKNRLDCGKAHCGLCHYGKWDPKARNTKKRAAIQFELEAE